MNIDVFPFSSPLIASQSLEAVGLGYLPLLVLVWFFWRIAWNAVGSLIIMARELLRGNPGLYLFCFPKFQPRETGETHKLKHKASVFYGRRGPRHFALRLLDPGTSLYRLWKDRKGGSELPFKSLRPLTVGSITKAGMEIRNKWFRPGLKIILVWEETQAGDTTEWRRRKIDVRPDKENDIAFNESFQLSLKID